MAERDIRSLADVPPSLHGCVLTIGNFDGVHRGHRKLAAAAVAAAKRAGTVAVVLTFDPPPGRILRPADTPERVCLPGEKVALLHGVGIDHVVTITPEPSLLKMDPETFLDDIIARTFSPSCLVEGNNFHFGAGRSGSIETLQSLAAARGWTVEVVEPATVELDGEVQRVSSTLVRKLIKAGRVADAGRLLERPFVLSGVVVRGEGIGKKLDFPTANLDASGQVVPADGVYAARALFGGESRPAPVSIGAGPTFGGKDRTVETHIPGIDEDLYGRGIKIQFFKRLRDQKHFASADLLREQIERDVAETLKVVADD